MRLSGVVMRDDCLLVVRGRLGYTDPDWDLHPSYDVPTILREALEEYLATHSPVNVEIGRLAPRL